MLGKNIIDEKSVSPRPIGIRYGLILGLVSLVLSLGMTMTDMIDYSGTKSNIISNIISWSATAVILYLAINEHKTKELGGYISLGRCLGVGFWAGLVAGVIGAVGMTIYFKFIDPSFFSNLMSEMRDNFEEKGMAEDQIDAAIKMVSFMFSPAVFAAMGTFFSVIFDLIIAFFIGLVVKKESPTPFN